MPPSDSTVSTSVIKIKERFVSKKRPVVLGPQNINSLAVGDVDLLDLLRRLSINTVYCEYHAAQGRWRLAAGE